MKAEDASLARLAALAQQGDRAAYATFLSKGNPTPKQAQAFLAAGYTEEHILGIILAISVETISNYSNHIFHTEIDPAFAGRAWSVAA